MRLLLFDVDGTLLRAHGAGKEALAGGLEAVFGTTGPIDDYQFSGKTDPRIITDLMTAAGIPAADISAGLPAVYDYMTQVAAAFPPDRFQPCAGVPALLDALADRPDVMLGLLTGNIRQTTPFKLAAAGIDPALFPIGAYGSDDMDRNALPAVARRRAAKRRGAPFADDAIVIVGDTPADIICARAGQTLAVAVATGRYAAGSLTRYHPDYLLDNLADTEKVLSILLTGQRRPFQA